MKRRRGPRKKNRIAFGIEPDTRSYRLRLARYVALARTLHAYADARRAAGDREALHVVDIGVGSGRSLQYADPGGRLPGFRWTGIDNSPDRFAYIHNPSCWNLIAADIEQGVPLGASSADVVVCEQVLEHLRDPGRTLGEIVRILRPGGIAILGVPSFPPPVALLRRMLEGLKGASRRPAPGHMHTFTKTGFVDLCRAAGLRIEEVRGFRIVSGGLLAPLENCRWWWRVNRWLGARLPSLCIEVQIVATRP